MKKMFFTAFAALGTLFGCARNDKEAGQAELVNPDGFVLEHPAIDVADPVATAAWWCENLGFTITKQKDDQTHTTFLVDADIERLTKAGATLVVHEKAPGFEGAMMRDPFGIAIQFVKREQSVLLK